MNCKRARDVILTDYIDTNLNVSALGELEAHLKACPVCRLLAEEAKKAGDLFENPARKDPPPEIWRNIHAEISREASEKIRTAHHFPKKFMRENRVLSLFPFLPNLRPAVVAIGAVAVLLFAAAAVRLVSIGNYMEAIQARDDIITMASINGSADEPESKYDLGTPAEIYFL